PPAARDEGPGRPPLRPPRPSPPDAPDVRPLRPFSLISADRGTLASMQPVRDWTVLVYMTSNNNLANGAKGLLRHQLGELEPSDRVSIAVEYSHLRGEPNYIWPDAVTHRRCEVQPHGLKTVEERPYENMAAPQTLESFLRWGIRKYPAKRYVV